jgi:hypothetical protein
MKKKVLIGFAVAAVLLFAGVVVVSAQWGLLDNGGAEDDLSPEWVVLNGNFTRSMSNGPVWPYDGSWMFDAGPDTFYSALQQGIPVAGYCTFCAGGYMYTASNDEGQIRVDFYDGGGGYITDYRTGRISNPDFWGHEDVCGDVPANAVTVDVTVQGYRFRPDDIHTFYDDLYFDAWECEEEFVPEWGTIALLGSGLMGMAGYASLRLRKRS